MRADPLTTYRAIRDGHGYCADFVKVFLVLATRCGFGRPPVGIFVRWVRRPRPYCRRGVRSCAWPLAAARCVQQFSRCRCASDEPLGALEYRDALLGDEGVRSWPQWPGAARLHPRAQGCRLLPARNRPVVPDVGECCALRLLQSRRACDGQSLSYVDGYRRQHHRCATTYPDIRNAGERLGGSQDFCATASAWLDDNWHRRAYRTPLRTVAAGFIVENDGLTTVQVNWLRGSMKPRAGAVGCPLCAHHRAHVAADSFGSGGDPELMLEPL